MKIIQHTFCMSVQICQFIPAWLSRPCQSTLCRSTLTQSTPGPYLVPFLDPIRGSPPYISPRSWRGPAASDEGPWQVSPITRTQLTTDISYVGSTYMSEIDRHPDLISNFYADFAPTYGRTPRLLRVSSQCTWQSISAGRFGSRARMDVTTACVPHVSHL